MARYIFFLLFLLMAVLAESKQPEIAPRDVKNKIEEVLRAHASHKRLTTLLMQRTLENYLNELDPSKTYFLEGEIEQWLYPSQETLQRGLSAFKEADFSFFQEIHGSMIDAIERRRRIEEEIRNAELPHGVKSEEFKEFPWAKTEDELRERLLRIKALQIEVCEKLGEEDQEKFIARIDKRRLSRETELIGQNLEERLKLTLTYLLKAVTSSLDSHTNYFTPLEANQFMIQVQQRLFGIGAQLRDNLDGLSVVRILENSPASQGNKLKINDRIIAVNHESIVGLDIADAVEMIRGEKGTSVLLTLLRDSGDGDERKTERLDIELIRGEVVLEETRLDSSWEPYGDGAIAYLRLFSFYQDQNSSSAGDLRKILEEIKKERSLKGVVLDLRGNAGGLLTQAVEVTGLFIHKGVVVSIKDSNNRIQHLREIEGKPSWEGPLLILVNRASASAAEIVAQTLQDYGRALVVGDDHTFGKGTFQTFTLDPTNHPKINPQGEYKVTRGTYYTVSGKSPQLTGVASDLIVPGMLSELDIGEKFAKFPLENDEISPHFEDDLSDISPFHRIQLGPLYKYNMQTKLSTYESYKGILSKNSEQRMKANKNYQNFLKELSNKNYDAEPVELFGQSDLQLVETMNIMKDLIFLMKTPLQ